MAKNKMTAWERVCLARMMQRPTALEYIEGLFEDFIPMSGDRLYGEDKAIVGGVAMYHGRPVTVIGQQKGRSTRENMERNFGMPHPEGYRKALRLMKQAEKFHRPIICLVDTSGAYCGVGAEERGQGEAIARNLMEMATLKVPVISIIIGEGGSGGALAMAVANKVWMLENSVYSILSPEGFASILWKDASRAQEAAEVCKLTAADLYRFGVIDMVLQEPKGGAHIDPQAMIQTIDTVLQKELDSLCQMGENNLVTQRMEKFRYAF